MSLASLTELVPHEVRPSRNIRKEKKEFEGAIVTVFYDRKLIEFCV